MIIILIVLALFMAQGPPQKRVQVYVVVPTSYVSNATPEQAMNAVPIWMLENQQWFQNELGQSIVYDLTRLDGFVRSGTSVDACGSFSGVGLYEPVMDFIRKSGYRAGSQDRTMILVMGAGGWAGHFSPPNKVRDHFGMVGDWGVMEQYDQRNACIPDWDNPNRGFSHELAGMMGMYVGGGCYGDGQGCFVNDSMSEQEKADLLEYSGRWFR